MSRGVSPRPAPDVAYDAHYFDAELHRDHWFTNNARKRERRWREVLRMLEPCPGDTVLEIGCGAGAHTLRIAPLARAAVGSDRAFAGVARARDAALRARIDNAVFAGCDAAALPFPAATFDKVAAIDFVEHVSDESLLRILNEVRRVLRADGRLAIYTPCATHYVERLKARNLVLRQLPGHIAVRAPDAYARLLGHARFAIARCWFSPSDYPLFGAFDRWLSRLPAVGPWFRFRICIVAVPR